MLKFQSDFSSKYKRMVVPFKAKLVEPIYLLPMDEREAALKEAGYNVVNLLSHQTYLDFLSDSGTGALSSLQVASMITASQAYFNTPSFFKLQRTVKDILGFPYVIPVHQGRGGQHVFDYVLLQKGSIVAGNTPFVVVSIAIEMQGGKFVDCIATHSVSNVFNGNIDLPKLENVINENASKLSYIMITVQCSGKPISMENIRNVSSLAKKSKVMLCCDAARFTENAYYIKKYEEGYNQKKITEIVSEMFSYFDACLMSGKKDAIVPAGGFIALKDEKLADKIKVPLIAFEGYDTYGGMTSAGMDAMAQGLIESTQDEYCAHRVEQIHRFAALLQENNIPIIEPPFSHFIKIDAHRFFPNVPIAEYPSYLLAAELYMEGGIRCTPHRDESKGIEICLISIPRRTYSFEHFEYVADVCKTVFQRKGNIRNGFKLVSEKSDLFSCKFVYA
ncbi:Tryptophanase-like protein [Leptotrombidium deliense]|uniref:Tryptophanase-like protein n=1 Tax=Leptotrombidium deliense TaxID=299467 RepID=A0A443SCG7_9ACAR|nr:Tryptophanase-like protein [Leptotrombidium deliense]